MKPRGGKREGAGRKLGSGNGRTVKTSSISLMPDLWDRLDELRGAKSRSAWIADKIKKARTHKLMDAALRARIQDGTSSAFHPAPCSRFRCVVADPPWEYKGGFNGWGDRKALPYAHMDFAAIKAMPVADLIEREGYLFLWTTNRWLERSFEVARAWECTPRQTLTWCKPKGGKGLGGMFATNTEFVVIAQKIREGTNAHGSRTNQEREGSSWFEWPKQKHSQKPEAFQDMVERVCPGPYLELFARRKRLGWSSWGNEVPCDVQIDTSNAEVSHGDRQRQPDTQSTHKSP